MMCPRTESIASSSSLTYQAEGNPVMVMEDSSGEPELEVLERICIASSSHQCLEARVPGTRYFDKGAAPSVITANLKRGSVSGRKPLRAVVISSLIACPLGVPVLVGAVTAGVTAEGSGSLSECCCLEPG